jgi:hypothetical protein
MIGLAALLLVAACSDPMLNAGISIGAGGVTVKPSLSADVGGLGVTVTP